MNSIYAALRRTDDIVDGDFDAYRGYAETPLEYVNRLVGFIERGSGVWTSEVEWLLGYAVTLAETERLDLGSEVTQVLLSLRFDAKRRVVEPAQIPVIWDRATLQQHFHRLDICGTIGACLKISGDYHRGIRAEHFEILGEATRIQLTLEDLQEDLRQGFCNIPKEDVEKFHIALPTARDSETVQRWYETEGVRQWCISEAERGRELLAQHRRLLGETPLVNLGWRTKVVLPVMYGMPAERTFWSVIAGKL